MGVEKNISFQRFPKQHHWKGTRVIVFYKYDLSRGHEGEVVRMDTEQPFVTILKTDEGRYVLDTECQWQPLTVGRIEPNEPSPAT